MATITINRFQGSIPRLEPHLLPVGAAARAVDCKLWSGALESWREPEAAQTVPDGTVSVYELDCDWMTYSTCVDIARGPVNCRQYFVTGRSDYPEILAFAADGSPVYSRLGVPCAFDMPTITPGSVSPTVSGEKDIEARSYAYQYVNAFGHRGSLSQGSEPAMIHDGQPVVVSGWPVPDASWNVSHIRLYRTVSSEGIAESTLSSTLLNEANTSWMLVAEIPVTAVSYTDTTVNELLVEALEEDIVMPPPDGLQGITHIVSMNALAGFVGRRIYFSENNHYHNWPHFHDLDDNIKAIKESNGVVYVMTDGYPYIIPAVADCNSAECREPVRLGQPLPMIGAGSRRVAEFPGGVFYPTHNGLVMLTSNAGPQIVTHAMYSPEDWQMLQPTTVVPVVHLGRLFVFANGGSFVMNIGNMEQGWTLDAHSELSDTGVIDAFVSRTGDLYYLKGNTVWRWDRGTALREHIWESAEAALSIPVNMAAGHIRALNGSEYLTVKVDGEVVEARDVYSHHVFRLPNWCVGTRWSIELKGKASVSLISLATSMKELGA